MIFAFLAIGFWTATYYVWDKWIFFTPTTIAVSFWCGVGLAYLVAASVDAGARVALAGLPMAPEHVVVLPATIAGAAIVLALLAAAAGAAWPAVRAARAPLSRALSEL